MSIQTTFTFEEHDKLNRKPFAEFLLSLIEHRNEHRRPNSNASYSIAIDAAYGSGKTRFLRMLQSMVLEDNNYSLAYYSAWEHDLYDDALTPILSLLDQESGVFSDVAYERMEKSYATKALDLLKKMGTSFLLTKAKKYFDNDVDAVLDDLKDLLKSEKPLRNAYDVRMECIRKLQNGLRAATEDKPLIFIIDELDRCNPSFAIKTLEVAKHLLDVENVIFIFAIDMRQMSAAVRKFYGQDIDADGYLCKIFDYMTLLPATNPERYIKKSLQAIDPAIRTTQGNLYSLACEILISEHCTLRFIDTFLSAFSVLWHTLLKHQEIESISSIYFISLYLKYRYPDTFHSMAGTTPITAEHKSVIKRYINLEPYIAQFLDICSSTIHDAYGQNLISAHVRTYKDNPQRFAEIKRLTYGQFIHRQLEMYNPIRTEKPVENSPTT